MNWKDSAQKVRVVKLANRRRGASWACSLSPLNLLLHLFTELLFLLKSHVRMFEHMADSSRTRSAPMYSEIMLQSFLRVELDESTCH